MTNTSIAVEADSLGIRPGRPATGNIWLVINGHAFPAPQWNDFIVVILGWWAESLLRLLRNSSTKETVNFMDGPYAVEVSKTSSGGLHFRALEGANRSIERASGEGPALQFIRELISQSRDVLEGCRRQRWWSEDAEKLESSLDALQKESSQLVS
jgi:hypothetical protein